MPLLLMIIALILRQSFLVTGVPLLTKTIGLVTTMKRKERLLKIQRNEDCNESGNNISCPPTS